MRETDAEAKCNALRVYPTQPLIVAIYGMRRATCEDEFLRHGFHGANCALRTTTRASECLPFHLRVGAAAIGMETEVSNVRFSYSRSLDATSGG